MKNQIVFEEEHPFRPSYLATKWKSSVYTHQKLPKNTLISP